jgi:hypothetical protein
LIHATEDGGGSWTKYEAFPDVPKMTYVNEVLASQHDRETVYAAFNNHKQGDFKPYILRSSDLGKTWSSISANLPEKGTVYAIAEDHVNPNLLFVGTEFSVFFTLDGGEHWKKLSSGLPTIAVRDIEIHKRGNDIVLGTFGRGFYVLDNYAPLRDFTEDVLETESHLFEVSDGLMFLPSSRIGSSGKAYQGAAFFTEKNPDVGAKITYYVKESIKTKKETRAEAEKKAFKADEPISYPTPEQLRSEEEEQKPFLLFTITDQGGRVVRTLEAPAKKGIGRINWDLRLPSATVPRGGGGGGRRSSAGILVVPGRYKVQMAKSVDGKVTRLAEPVDFEVRPLNNRTLPASSWEDLNEFQGRLVELSRAMNGAQGATRQLREKIGTYRSALGTVPGPSDDVKSDILALEKKLAAVQRQLSGDSVMRRLDLSQQPSISSRINSAVFGGFRSTSDPTEMQRQVFEIVEDEFDPLIQQINEMLSNDAPRIESKLDELGAAWTPGRKVNWRK